MHMFIVLFTLCVFVLGVCFMFAVRSERIRVLPVAVWRKSRDAEKYIFFLFYDVPLNFTQQLIKRMVRPMH